MGLPSYVVIGDCLHALAAMPSDSVHAIVTDPPYGLAFMGKDWDKALPDPEIWKQCLRVLKPGGHMVAFGAPRIYHRLAVAIEDSGFQIRDCLMWVFGSGFPKSLNVGKRLDDWQGYGTALKPAYEPILLARKTLVGTVAANVLEHGSGALNIDGCRVGASGGTDRTNTTTHTLGKGRWPANLILDEASGAMLDGQSGVLKTSGGVFMDNAKNTTHAYGKTKPIDYNVPSSEGGASRFFYCAKASRKEREAGLEKSAEGRANKHPTVKPISLMRWLVRLVGAPGCTIVDPFTGSGSTGVACVREGFGFIGMELDGEHAAVAGRRIAFASLDPEQQ